MKPIPITLPYPCRNESEAILALIDAGVEIIHIRKGDYNRELLELLPQSAMKNLTIHYDKTLCEEFDLGGAHLRANDYMIGRRNSVSCHHIEELNGSKDYSFLSPIFDSVSKVRYNAAFETDKLNVRGLKCVALGGITKDNVSIAAKCGFYGVALIGSLWAVNDSKIDVKQTVKNYNEIGQRWIESISYYNL